MGHNCKNGYWLVFIGILVRIFGGKKKKIEVVVYSLAYNYWFLYWGVFYRLKRFRKKK